MDNTINKIKSIIEGIKPSAEVFEDTRLLDDHVLDSLSIVLLVSELCEEFDIEISPMDVIPENFATVKDISDLIERIEEDD